MYFGDNFCFIFSLFKLLERSTTFALITDLCVPVLVDPHKVTLVEDP